MATKRALTYVLGGTVSVLALLASAPAAAQTVPDPTRTPPQGQIDTPAGARTTDAAESGPTTGPHARDELAMAGGADIIVTAQRRAETLQNVPIAVSAFTGEALDRMQIENSSDLQLTLPNVTYTKTNFTASSFTIRGIGDLCVGVTCDSATAIHMNDMPLLSTRLFETEFFDLERVEVLRGPQGTLFGRNATSGVVNFITARPDFNRFAASAQAEYGNYNSFKLSGMLNVPVADTIGVRVAGLYLNRDGYTLNTFTGNQIDGRDLWAVRGTLSWEPTPDTRIDLIGYYFREDDDRSRIQKQMCNRDPTGVLGCLPDRLAFGVPNGNSTLAAIHTSREFFNLALGGLAPIFSPMALGSVYGPDTYQGVVNPADMRTVRLDYEPTYFALEQQYMAKLRHDFGPVTLSATGGWASNEVRSRTDYNLAVQNSYLNNPGLIALNALAANPHPVFGTLLQGPLGAVRNTLIPGGPGAGICQSDADPNGVGVYGGNSVGCFATSLDFDESSQRAEQYSAEAHITSNLTGMFNFLLGAIYFDSKTFNNSYYVNSFGLDYAAGLLGAAATIGQRLPPAMGGAGNAAFPNVFRASPFYRSNTDFFNLKSWGLFGETYFDINERLKLTLGLRYNHDDKFVRARTTYIQDAAGNAVLVPYGGTSIRDALGYAGLDFDAVQAGAQEWAENRVQFGRLTGRAVVDYRLTPDSLLYFSYSRGYKSGGINPPLSPVFAVPTTFNPETVDSFEIGSKNTLMGGTLRFNATAFYYRYSDLQLSRIVARTSVNDNVSASIFGVEFETLVRPTPALLINLNLSFLDTRVSEDKFLANPRDPSGGRADAVIIKDLTNASNCAIVPTTAGNRAGVNAFVSTVNQLLGLQPTTPVPGTNTTGAFGVCGILQAAAAGNIGAASAALALPQPALGGLTPQQFLNLTFAGGQAGPLPFAMLGSGVERNIRGNQLPQAPNVKFSAGAQYAIEFANGMSLVPRVDFAYTGESFGTIFNLPIDRIPGYEIINAQVQLNGLDDRWFVRAFVQNLTANDAITGMYVTDQSSGLFTNVFTLEPRRYGVAAGIRF